MACGIEPFSRVRWGRRGAVADCKPRFRPPSNELPGARIVPHCRPRPDDLRLVSRGAAAPGPPPITAHQRRVAKPSAITPIQPAECGPRANSTDQRKPASWRIAVEDLALNTRNWYESIPRNKVKAATGGTMAFQTGGYVISTNKQSLTSQGTPTAITQDTLKDIAKALGIFQEPDIIKPKPDHPVNVQEVISIHVFRPSTSPK
jgi:hypothetical protein